MLWVLAAVPWRHEGLWVTELLIQTIKMEREICPLSWEPVVLKTSEHSFASAQTEIQGIFSIRVKTKAVCSLIINLQQEPENSRLWG